MKNEPLIEKGREHFLAKRVTREIKRLAKKYWWLGLVFLLFIGWFYWFQWRPTRIRSYCAKEVATMLSGSDRTITNFQKTYDLFYESCLNQKGLK